MKAGSDVLDGNGLVIDSKIIFLDRSRLTNKTRAKASTALRGAVFCRERLRKKI